MCNLRRGRFQIQRAGVIVFSASSVTVFFAIVMNATRTAAENIAKAVATYPVRFAAAFVLMNVNQITESSLLETLVRPGIRCNGVSTASLW
jgi:hypothetical protein